MWEAELTLTQAREIFLNSVKCKFRLETAEAAIPGEIIKKNK